MEMTAVLLWAGHVSESMPNLSDNVMNRTSFQARKGCALALTSIDSYISISNVRVSSRSKAVDVRYFFISATYSV